MKINIHAGHNPDGKIACGAVGILKESTQARKVVKYVIGYLKRAGHTVYDCTCNNGKNQNDVLKRIVQKCNAHSVDLDVSVHFNAGAGDLKGNKKTTGTEVLVYATNKKPTAVANKVVNEIAALGFKNRGVKSNPSLYVLNQTKAPAMLIECCFVDDKDDASLYNAKKMAQAITVGILNSYGVQKYTTKKKIRTFNEKFVVIGKKEKGKQVNIDKFKFINNYLMGHTKKTNEWLKIKYLK